MAWYWIVLIIVGYFLIGILTAFIYLVYGEDDEEALVMFGALWPVFLPVAIVIAPFVLFYWIIDNIFFR